MRTVERLLVGVSAATVLFMMALTGVDVVGRHVLDAPVAGAFELTEFAMAIGVYSALPVVTLRRAHVAADLFGTRLGPGARRAQRGLADLLGTLAFAAIAWRLVLEGLETAEYGTTAGTLELPLAPLSFYAAALSALTALVFAAHLVGLTGGAGVDGAGAKGAKADPP